MSLRQIEVSVYTLVSGGNGWRDPSEVEVGGPTLPVPLGPLLKVTLGKVGTTPGPDSVMVSRPPRILFSTMFQDSVVVGRTLRPDSDPTRQ